MPEFSNPQVRIYVESENLPPVAVLSTALSDYEMIPSHSGNEVALIRKIVFDAKDPFMAECLRVVEIMAPRVVAEAHINCVYDDANGCSRFHTAFYKSIGNSKFVEVEDE